MKKLLLLFTIIPFLFSCGGDDDNDDESGLKFIQVKIACEDGSIPKGKAAIFYGTVTDCGSRDNMFYGKTDKGEDVFYIGKGDLSPKTATEENVSSINFFWSNLATAYGKPQPNQYYTIYIKLSDSDFSYKTFYIEDKNKQIIVKFPNPSGGAKKVDAEWSIEDYKGL